MEAQAKLPQWKVELGRKDQNEEGRFESQSPRQQP